jgi:hypothetical protein
MSPTQPVDALLLFALALASKRRPADLTEVVAAADLSQGAQGIIPSSTELSEAFARLSGAGLIGEDDRGLVLTPEAQKLMASLPRKADTLARVAGIRERLAAHAPVQPYPVIMPTPEQLDAAIAAHRANGKSPAQNLLIPKPKPADSGSKPGQRQRKPRPGR